MKNYKLIAVLAASMAFTTGCYDLDVFPEDQLNLLLSSRLKPMLTKP